MRSFRLRWKISSRILAKVRAEFEKSVYFAYLDVKSDRYKLKIASRKKLCARKIFVKYFQP